jgi:anaerobic dimethyl sulfoxide reductase subunit C
MNVSEWSLIIFTILGQMAVGAFLVLGVVHFFAVRKAGVEEADRLSDRALLAIGVVMILAFLASLLHLGNPFNAPLAVTNLATSWLSWEILLGVIFAVLGGAFGITQWRKISTFAVRNVIAILAAIVGIGLIVSMAMVYMLETQPAWNTFQTPVSFFTTTVLLGSLALGTAFVANYAYVRRNNPACEDIQCELMRGALRWIALVSIIMLGVEFFVIPVYLATLASLGGEAALSASLMVNEFGIIFSLRLILAFIGAGVFGMFIYQNAISSGQERLLSNYAYAAFALVLFGEVLGRFLFYATQVQIGL